MKLLLILNKIVSYTPLGWLIIFGVFILRAYLKIGHMPSYNLPDPKDLDMNINYNLTFWGLPIVILSIIFWILSLVSIFFIDKKKIVKKDIPIYIVAYLTIFFLLRSEALGLGDWLID